MYKLNVLPVKLLNKPVSKNGSVFSHEQCDVCGTQGIVYEAISYQDKFDYNNLRYHSTTFKRYQKSEESTKQFVSQTKSWYIIYYLCSEECSLMLQMQQPNT